MTSPKTDPTLAPRIRERRAELMLTQAEAAGEIGISRALYQRWEGGKVNPRPRLRRQLEAWLNGGMR